MEDKSTKKNKRRCSFCGRTEDEVGFLITGVNGCICDSCSEQAHEIVQEAMRQKGNSTDLNLAELPKPKDIKDFRTSEHRSMYSYVRLSIDRCTATYV